MIIILLLSCMLQISARNKIVAGFVLWWLWLSICHKLLFNFSNNCKTFKEKKYFQTYNNSLVVFFFYLYIYCLFSIFIFCFVCYLWRLISSQGLQEISIRFKICQFLTPGGRVQLFVDLNQWFAFIFYRDIHCLT